MHPDLNASPESQNLNASQLPPTATRRDLLRAAGGASLAALGLAAGGAPVAGADPKAASSPAAATPFPTSHHPTPGKTFRIGVVSAAIKGKPQKLNGHTWHFANGMHPECDLAAIKKFKDPGSAKIFETYFRNPRTNFDTVPFPDTRITCVYDADPTAQEMYCQAFPGVKIVKTLEDMMPQVDAIFMGDASGYGEDHYDLVAPGLEAGKPTFCDKPIGGTIAGTRKILELAKSRKTPLMSSSLYRHQWGTEQALRYRDSKEFGEMTFAMCSQAGGHNTDRWLVYGQHPTWMIMTLCGPGVKAVNMIEHGDMCHVMLTYENRAPAEIWCGRPDMTHRYCHTQVHFQTQEKGFYQWTPAIDGEYWLGHHYQMMRLQNAFVGMCRTGIEPVPHQEILEVTAIVHAALKSRDEKSRFVELAEVLG
ncbi:MAG: Gfo/Idh/MocA family oxidoreductase [Planctomycetia bacterium]|nr:Gfo/Idh/MocA family oxidoreductase [Planctomycetia bacterium]